MTIKTITQKADLNMPPQMSAEVTSTLAHHEAAITNLGGRMSGVENGLRTLQGEVHAGFAGIANSMNTQISALGSKLDKLDAQPKFDFHKMVGTIVSLAGLFALICGGIIYITNSQNAALVAEQKAFNSNVGRIVEKHEGEIDSLKSWSATVIVGARK